ncbi:hypothetical protein BH20VER1_BH20VER1_21760 [soil metagenome]
MDEQLQEDPFDAKLREEMSYIDDDGFTSRVAQQLPVRRRKSAARTFFLASVALVAVVVAYVVAGRGAFVMDVLGWFAVMPVGLLLTITIGAGLVVTAFGLYAAIARARKVRS